MPRAGHAVLRRAAGASAARRVLAGRAAAVAATSLFAVAAAEAACIADLPESVLQGALVVGRIDPGCAVSLGARALRVSAEGTFVFGVGRDAKDVTLSVAGEPVALAVTARDYRIERVDGVPQSTVTPNPKIAARIAREQAEVAEARTRDDDRADFRYGFVRPAPGRVSGVYGSQRILNGTPKDPHYGLDLASPTGTPVKAPAGGIVSFAHAALYLTGGTVLIDHGHGLSSSFLHLSKVGVKVGQRIEQGEVLGAVGMTGRASGPHLHWGMSWFGVRIDPQLLIDPR